MPRIGWLPVGLRPLLLGLRIVPVVVLAATLFVVDLGFPMAAAQVPAAIAGGDDEWVQGAGGGLVVGGDVLAAPGHVLSFHPDVEAAVAEILLPTTLDGDPIVLRGGHWEDLSRFHHLHDLEGGTGGLVLGARAASRHDLSIGDTVLAQHVDRPLLLPLRVTGIFHGGGPLSDEGILDMEWARDLSDTPAGHADLVRVRPGSSAALAALGSSEGRIEVVGLQAPEGVPAGSTGTAFLRLVNVGGGEASRTIALRVDGVPVASATLQMAPWEERVLEVPFKVPAGTYWLAVNPEASGTGAQAGDRLAADAVQYGSVQARLTSAEGAPLAGLSVGLFRFDGLGPSGEALATATTDGQGRVDFVMPPGRYVVQILGGREQSSTVWLVPESYRDGVHIEVAHAWTDGNSAIGSTSTLYAQVINLGGRTGTQTLDLFQGEARFHFVQVSLGPGETTLLEIPFTVQEGVLRIGNYSLSPAISAAPGPGPVDGVVAATQLQGRVADRVLGDAQRALMAIAALALASSLSIVFLGTQRTLQGRRRILWTYAAFGEDEDALRARVAWEGAVLGGGSFLVALLLGKVLFLVLGRIGWPTPFAHSLSDPFGWLLGLQAMTAFAAACALAAFLSIPSRTAGGRHGA